MQVPSSSSPVLVIGAGPVGLTMACELARHGVRVRIIDKAPEPSRWSKALAVFPRTLEVLEAMGIIVPFVTAGQALHALSLNNASGHLARLSLTELPSPYRFVLSLPQSETERLLTEHLASYHISVERNTEFLALTQNTDGVTASLRRADGRLETVQTPWLIACDGAHSGVRHALGINFAGEAYLETFVLADAKVHAALTSDEAHLYFASEGIMAIFPMAHGRARVIASLPGGDIPENHTPEIHEIESLVQERGLPSAKLTDSTWISEFHISRRKIPNFRNGRVFLAGDAAHIHSPAGGQGMNTGIQDAFNLAWKLAHVLHGTAEDTLLDSYDAERGPVAESVLKLTDRLTRMATARNPVIQQIRDLVIPLLTGIEAVGEAIAERMAELTINYRSSPIVSNHGAHWLCAGDRAPDGNLHEIPGQRRVRLFELLRGTQHILLLFEGRDGGPDVARHVEQICHEVKQNYSSLVTFYVIRFQNSQGKTCPAGFLDETGELHQRYGTINGGLILIRPDWYIGCRADLPREECLWDHLEKLFPGHRPAAASLP